MPSRSLRLPPAAARRAREVVALSAALAAACVGLGGCSGGADRPAATDAGAEDAAGADAGPSAADAGRLPVITPNDAGWWRGAVGYEVFVRSFYDSNGDGVGDLPGLLQKLDHLNDGQPGGADLGVDVVWLMPINASPSYHGYDVTDYRAVNPAYGTLEDFRAFTRAAHARGVRVLMDLSLNHSSAEHPWFLSALRGPDAPHRDHYLFRAVAPGWKRPWDNGAVWHPTEGGFFYALFGPALPDLNLAHPAVEAELRGVMKYWLEQGADGFRVDAARYLVETEAGVLADTEATHQLMRRTRHALHLEHPEALFVAEAWVGSAVVASYYGAGDEYQLAFSFDLAAAMKGAIQSGAKDALVEAMRAGERDLPDRGYEAPFLSNHDMQRVAQQLGGDPAKLRLAAALLFAQPGTPFLYYGEELGMLGGTTPHEEAKRTTMRWSDAPPMYGFTSTTAAWYPPAREAPGVDVASQRADAGSLLGLYRALIALRKSSGPLMHGDARVLSVAAGRGTFALLRTHAERRVLFVANADAAASAPFSLPLVGNPRVLEASGLVAAPVATQTTIDFAGLMPRGFAFIALDD